MTKVIQAGGERMERETQSTGHQGACVCVCVKQLADLYIQWGGLTPVVRDKLLWEPS
jgi:hypothetical protein